MSKLRGNRTLTGTWGEIWVDGVLIAELSKIEVKVSANREDVQLDIDVDSKMTGIKGEFTLTIKKAYTRYNQVLESWKKGVDLRSQIITKLADPDATNGQQERYSIDNCWYNDLPLVTYEKGRPDRGGGHRRLHPVRYGQPGRYFRIRGGTEHGH